MNHWLYIGILIVVLAAGVYTVWRGLVRKFTAFLGILVVSVSIVLILIGLVQGGVIRDTPAAIYQVDRVEPGAPAHELHVVILYGSSPVVATIDCIATFDAQFCTTVQPGATLQIRDEYDFSGFRNQRTFTLS